MKRKTDVFRASHLVDGLHCDAREWSPERIDEATKNEVFTNPNHASGSGFAVALAARRAGGAPWLWVQDEVSQQKTGRPYLHGLPAALQSGFHYICVKRCEDALFAMEEGLRCSEMACIIGELSGDPKAIDFTASRRLAVASETFGVPLYLIRNNGARNLSAARMRWAIASAPSSINRWNRKAPGNPQWRADLFRSRLYRPKNWMLSYEQDKLSIASDHLDMAAPSGDQSLAKASA